MRSDRRLTLRMISSALNLNRFTVHQTLTQDLNMRKVCAKMVPKNLTTEQKANRRHVFDQALHALGCCTTTTPHVTRQSPSMNFWHKKHSCGSSVPYSPDLSPCDFFLFPRLKTHLKGRHFGTLDNIQKSVTDELKGIPAEAFQQCYEQWKQCLRRCVAAQGN